MNWWDNKIKNIQKKNEIRNKLSKKERDKLSNQHKELSDRMNS